MSTQTSTPNPNHPTASGTTQMAPAMPTNQAHMTHQQAEQFVAQLIYQESQLGNRIQAGLAVMSELSPNEQKEQVNPRDSALLYLVAESVDRLKSNREAIRQQITVVKSALEQHGKLVHAVPAGAVPSQGIGPGFPHPGRFNRHK